MKKIKLTNYLLILFTTCSILTSLDARAQLKFKNEEQTPIKLAIAVFYDGDDFTGLASAGWMMIEPGETKVLIEPELNQPEYYIYATDEEGHIWAGSSGKFIFAVDNRDFMFKNPEKAYHGEKSESVSYLPFKKIEVGMLKIYTIKTNDLD